MVDTVLKCDMFGCPVSAATFLFKSLSTQSDFLVFLLLGRLYLISMSHLKEATPSKRHFGCLVSFLIYNTCVGCMYVQYCTQNRKQDNGE